ncbi:hypothetical protein [Paenibacillus campi]|uniref:hypothetical protein n=1 Tax=Paenibacillus campi TaxID=3106031 RepID=UPI002AFF3FA1|nr:MULTISPECIES: hypothetical protein [unclassified Paenibacillus]
MTLNNIIKIIKNIYESGNLSFLLSTYVDKDHYIHDFKKIFADYYVENMTDFNYSKCFNICINFSDIDCSLASQEFEDLISETGSLYRLEVQLSVIAPYALIKYLKYYKIDKTIEVRSSNVPFLPNQSNADKIIKQFLQEKCYSLLNDDILTQAVSGVKLELQEGTPSVYNCLFEDMSSYYPYNR